jgi:hypothetical protein
VTQLGDLRIRAQRRRWVCIMGSLYDVLHASPLRVQVREKRPFEEK